MQSIKQYIPYNIKDSTKEALKNGAEKTKDLYGKSKQQAIKIGQYLGPKVTQYVGYGQTQVVQINNNLPKLIESVIYLVNHPTTQKIKQIVQKYGMIIAATPAVRDLLISSLLKLTGYTAAGIKSGTLASLIQSSYYGGFVAKGSIFAKLQSIGALGIFDPTLITLLLLGGVTFYYFYVYSHSGGKENAFKWRMKDSLEKSQVTVPTTVTYTKDGKFDIKWSALETPHSKAWSSIY